MSKSLIEIEGFGKLQNQLKKLSDDKSKRRAVNKILGQLANPTLKAAKQLVPVSKKAHVQKRKNQRFGTVISPGTGKRSLGKKTMRRSANPTVYVSPRSTRKNDGWYLRQFVIPGTRFQRSQPFLDKAYSQTQGKVTADAERKMEKYIQKQIDKLI